MELLNFEEAAKLLKISSTHLEDCLRANKIFCTIEIDGEFLATDTRFENNSYRSPCPKVTVSSYHDGSRHMEFLIKNYSNVFCTGSTNTFECRKLKLSRLKEDGVYDGFQFQYYGHATKTKDDLRISQEEIDRFEAERDKAAAPGIDTTKDTETNTGGKEITTTTGTPDKKGWLQYAVEKYLDRNTDGTWEGFRIFLDEKINFPKQEVLFRKMKYRDFFLKTDKNGILLHDPKQGKTPADANFNRYTVGDIQAVIRKEKRERLKNNSIS